MSEPRQRDSDRANAETISVVSALHLLINLGWQFLTTEDALKLRGSTREVILKPRLIEVLQTRRFEYKGEFHSLSPGGIDQIVRQAQTLSLTEGLLPANERLYRLLTLGVTVTEFMPDGKKHQPTIALIDWQHTDANRWDVTEKLEVLSANGTHVRTPDVIGYVNGLPLAVIEASRPGAGQDGRSMMDEGIGQQLRNQRHDEIPQLFAYAQLLLVVSDSDARYGTTGTALKFWARWREEAFGNAQLVDWKNQPLDAEVQAALLRGKPAALIDHFTRLWSQPTLPTEQDRLMAALLQPDRLLEFLRLFVLFDRKVGKVVARYQQFFGIRALLARIQQRRPDGAREGGVVWHTTGSGKSFTMVFLTKALVLHESTQACRVLVVTDRIDLEDQLTRNLTNSGAFGSGRELALRIGQGNERIVFTLTHKFATASKLPECHNDSADLIVLVDEGHRSHGGEMHERMRKALPRAAYVAFTGTPLLKSEKTANRFGPIVHAYTMQRAVEDETVAPLLYEERLLTPSVGDGAANSRIERIARDIAQHFSENIGALGLGLKGQVATASKLDAIRYKRHLDDTGLVSSAVVISAPDNREGNTEVDENAIPEVQAWWNANVGKHPEAYEAKVLADFGTDGSPDLLIVVDRLLTGFDEPRNAVLYMDKSLKTHDLIQAVARVNRLHEAKRYGVLVDYRGILKALDTAVQAHQDLETRTQGGYELDDIRGLYRQFSSEYRQLPGLQDALWTIFAEVENRDDREHYRQVLMPRFMNDATGQSYDTRQKVRDDFEAALSRFGLCLQTALSSRSFFEDQGFSEQTLQTYRDDLQFFTDLRRIARLDAQETMRYSTHEEQIRRMVDKQAIGMEVREPEGVYLVQAPADWTAEKTRNETDMIRTRLKKTIEQELADDPYAQKVFAELLKQVIADAEAMIEHPFRQHALLRRFDAQVTTRVLDGMPDALVGHPQASAYFGICRLVLGEETFAHADIDSLVTQAFIIDKAVKQAVAEHSLNPHNIETSIRKALLPGLFKSMGLDKAKDAIEQVIRVMRIGLSRGSF